MMPSQQDLVEILRSEFVPALIDELAGLSATVDRVILYGSYAYGKPRENSDVDVAVIVAGKGMGKIRAICRDISKKMTTAGIPWRQIEGNEFDIAEIERMRRLTISIYSKILTAGIVLYENPETADQRQAAAAAALSAIDAQRDATLGQLLKARLLIGSSRKLMDFYPRELIAEEAYTAACFSIGAFLLNNGIDPLPLGSQYASQVFQDKRKVYGMTCSMSRKGNCWDNAPTESWFNSFKNERVHGLRYASHAEMKAASFEYIEVFYNRKRQHSTLGYRSPAQFLAQWI